MIDLNNKVALITGGTTGIGFAAAKVFADAGATVVVTGRNEKTLEAARKEFGDRVEVVKSDAGDPTDIAKLFAHIEKKYNGLDVLYLNAGIAPMAPIAKVEEDHFDQVMNVNVKGPLLAIKHATPLLRKGGSIVITSSVVNQAGMPGFAVYGISKAAVRSLVRTAAAELSSLGIRVNAVSPGPVETPIFSKLGLSQEEIEAFSQNIVTQIPLGRAGQAEEIGKAAAFLSSDEASFITGEELVVDGGMAAV